MITSHGDTGTGASGINSRCLSTHDFGATLRIKERWDGNSGKNADDHNDDQQFDQSEARLKPATLLVTLKALEEGSLGKQPSFEARGHGE